MKCMGFFLRLILLQVFIVSGVAWAEPVQPKVDRLDDMVVDPPFNQRCTGGYGFDQPGGYRTQQCANR